MAPGLILNHQPNSFPKHFKHHDALQIIGFIGTNEPGKTTTLEAAVVPDYARGCFRGRSSPPVRNLDGCGWHDDGRSAVGEGIHCSHHELWRDNGTFTLWCQSYFPATMKPAMAQNIPLWIKNTFNPNIRACSSATDSANGKLIKGISTHEQCKAWLMLGQRFD